MKRKRLIDLPKRTDPAAEFYGALAAMLPRWCWGKFKWGLAWPTPARAVVHALACSQEIEGRTPGDSVYRIAFRRMGLVELAGGEWRRWWGRPSPAWDEIRPTNHLGLNLYLTADQLPAAPAFVLAFAAGMDAGRQELPPVPWGIVLPFDLDELLTVKADAAIDRHIAGRLDREADLYRSQQRRQRRARDQEIEEWKASRRKRRKPTR